MNRESKFVFAVNTTDEELEGLKAFTAEISGIIQKHYHFTHHTEFVSFGELTAEMLDTAARTFVIMSGKPAKGDAELAHLQETVQAYRERNGDAITSYVADNIIGKSWRRKYDMLRSLEGFTDFEELKLQLYYDFCTYTETGGYKIAQGPRGGKVKLAQEELRTIDVSDIEIFKNPDIVHAKEMLEKHAADYRELKGLYAGRMANPEGFRQFEEKAESCSVMARKLDRYERQVSDIMDATADFKKWGILGPVYRVAYMYFRQGKFGEAYHALRTKSLIAPDYGYAKNAGINIREYYAAVSVLKAKMLQIIPDGYVEPGKKKPVNVYDETVNALEDMYWDVEKIPRLYGLVHMYLSFLRRHRDSVFDNRYRYCMQKAVDKLKKAKGDFRYLEFRFRYDLLDYYLAGEDYNEPSSRTIKAHLDHALSLAQELSKDYDGLYDMSVGDIYVTYSVYYANKGDMESMRDMLFCSADRYKNAIAANPLDAEPAHRLAETYRTLAICYSKLDEPDYAREYFGKCIERYEAVVPLDRVHALHDLADVYEEFANAVRPEDNPLGQQDVGETEDLLLKALECRKELAAMRPHEFEPEIGLTYDALASLFRANGYYDEGMDYYRSAAAEYKLCGDVFESKYKTLLAKCYSSMYMAPEPKDLDEALQRLMWAVECFQNAAEGDPAFFNPELALAWRHLADVQAQQGNDEDAIHSHLKSLETFMDADDFTDDPEDCFVDEEAKEFSSIAVLYDKRKDEDENAAVLAERYHLQAIGTAYCGNAGITDMEDTLKMVANTYILSVMHPGFNALIALLYHYVSNTTPSNLEDIADKVSDFSASGTDVMSEEERAAEHLLGVADKYEAASELDDDESLLLLGAYYALYRQYDTMNRDKEAEKFRLKAQQLYEMQFAPGDEDWDEDYDFDYSGDEPEEDLAMLRKVFGPELFEKYMNIVHSRNKPEEKSWQERMQWFETNQANLVAKEDETWIPHDDSDDEYEDIDDYDDENVDWDEEDAFYESLMDEDEDDEYDDEDIADLDRLEPKGKTVQERLEELEREDAEALAAIHKPKKPKKRTLGNETWAEYLEDSSAPDAEGPDYDEDAPLTDMFRKLESPKGKGHSKGPKDPEDPGDNT